VPRHARCFDAGEFQGDDPRVLAGRLHGSYADADGVGANESECTGRHSESNVSCDFNHQRITAGTRQWHRRLEHQLYERRALEHLDLVIQSVVLQHGKMLHLHPELTQTTPKLPGQGEASRGHRRVKGPHW